MGADPCSQDRLSQLHEESDTKDKMSSKIDPHDSMSRSGAKSPATHLWRWVGILLLFLMVGCSKMALFTDVSEQEANEMMALLLERSVACEKVAGKEGKWSIQVAPEDFPFAMHTLEALGLPRDKFQNMGEVFQKTGLVSSPTEERIRFVYALSQEISETMTKIDGVVSARVHIALPNNDPLSDKVKPPSAAVFIKYRPGFAIESNVNDLKNLVCKSIEGLTADNVEMVLSPAELTPPPARPKPTNKTAEFFADLPPWAVPTGAALGGFLLAGAIFMLFRPKESKRKSPA